MQGVVKAFDPSTGDGVVIAEADLQEYEFAPGALEASVFRMLRQGQRVIFDLDERRLVTRLRLGSEIDMGTPGFDGSGSDDFRDRPFDGGPDGERTP